MEKCELFPTTESEDLIPIGEEGNIGYWSKAIDMDARELEVPSAMRAKINLYLQNTGSEGRSGRLGLNSSDRNKGDLQYHIEITHYKSLVLYTITYYVI